MPLSPSAILSLPAGHDTDAQVGRLLSILPIVRYSTVIHDALKALQTFCQQHECGWRLGQRELILFGPASYLYYCQISGGNIQHPNTKLITAAEADSPELAICRALLLTKVYNSQKGSE